MPIYVYIAGPYDDSDCLAIREQRVEIAMHWWHVLVDAGFVAFCPHLSHYLKEFKDRPRADFLGQSIAWLDKCDCLLRLPGESPGSDQEVAEMQRLARPVFHSIEELIKAYQG